MVIKMSRDRIRGHIICRMLHRGKRINIFPERKYDDSARMLPRRPSDSDTSLYDTVNLTVSLMNAPFLVIIFYITKRCLIRQRTDRTGTERLTVSKNNLCIFMCLTLIIAGKIQIDIRLFISLKSKKCLKWNIKALFL